MKRRDFGFGLAVCCFGVSVLCGCSSTDAPSAGTGGPDSEGGACNVKALTVSPAVPMHVPICSPQSYPDNPPVGGDHYPVWAAFQSFSFPVPRGFWIHDLEHGAVVYTYNCSDGCADEVATVQAMIDALPSDPFCQGSPERRVVLTPDPLLDVRWGASAWGHSLRADCVDAERFRQFYLNHFGQGPEKTCNPGTDFAGTEPCK